jgi:GDSL-like Lipase/Acylhydrolase family
VTPGRSIRLGVATLAVIALLAGCGSTGTTSVARTQPTGPRTTYVAVGGSDSVGSGTDDPLLDAWPQQFFRHSLPLAAVFVNAGVPGSTVAAAMGDQAPLATSSDATVVTVWLVSADILDGTPPATYGAELLALLTTLRGGGATTVLVGNVPPLDQLPGYPACLDGAADAGRGFRCPAVLPDPATLAAASAAYDQVIAMDAARTGAILVDLRSSIAASAAQGGAPFLAPLGADLSTAGSTLVARTFGDALPVGARHTA